MEGKATTRMQKLSFYDKTSLFHNPPVLHFKEEQDMERALARTRVEGIEVRSALSNSSSFSHHSSFIIIIAVIAVIIDFLAGR